MVAKQKRGGRNFDALPRRGTNVLMNVEAQRARNNQLVAAGVVLGVDEKRVEAVGELMSTVFVGWSSSKDLVTLKS